MFYIYLLFMLHFTSRSHQAECQQPLDVLFVLDATVNFNQFEQMKNLVINALQDFDTQQVRIAVFSYSDNVLQDTNFNFFQTKNVVNQFVRNLTITNARPSIGKAFAAVRKNFAKDSDRRIAVPLVVILLSGGGVDNMELAISESRQLRDLRVTIIIATTNNLLPVPDFYMLTSYPYKENFFYANNYEAIQAGLIGTICSRTNPCQDSCQGLGQCIQNFNNRFCSCSRGLSGRSCNLNGCNQPVNVFFALTAASSINYTTFLDEVDFVQEVILNMNLDDSKVGVGVYYNNSIDVRFDFQKYDVFRADTTWFRQRMFDSMSFNYRGGYTNLTHVLRTVRQTIFPKDQNNVLVLFVSGPSADILSSAREAVMGRNGPEAIQILVVGAGQLYSPDEVSAIAITSNVNSELGDNIFLTNDFQSSSLASRLTDSICNTNNDCAANPCRNSGICIDFINGYRCLCPSSRVGTNCERDGNESIDLILGFDTSGSIRNYDLKAILNFAVEVVSQLDISFLKTRVGAVKWESRAYDLFHLNTYGSKQDVAWAIRQIASESLVNGTNTADALRLIRDVLLSPGQNGERPSARNVVLLFTDGNSNIDDANTIPAAVDLRVSRNAHVITFGIGTFVNFNEMTSVCSIPPAMNRDFFIVPSPAQINQTFNNLIQTLWTVDNCQASRCQNGGVCSAGRNEATCSCPGRYAGRYCETACSRSIDVAFVLDISGSAYFNIVSNRSVALTREIAILLPLETTKFSVVTFGNNARVNFYLKSFKNSQDLMDSLAFKLSTGPQRLQDAIGYLGNTRNNVFSSESGDRSASANVAIIVTSSDSPFEYHQILNEAQNARNLGTEIYALLINDWPNRGLYRAVVNQPDRLFVVPESSNLNEMATLVVTRICNNI